MQHFPDRPTGDPFGSEHVAGRHPFAGGTGSEGSTRRAGFGRRAALPTYRAIAPSAMAEDEAEEDHRDYLREG